MINVKCLTCESVTVCRICGGEFEDRYECVDHLCKEHSYDEKKKHLTLQTVKCDDEEWHAMSEFLIGRLRKHIRHATDEQFWRLFQVFEREARKRDMWFWEVDKHEPTEREINSVREQVRTKS